jgi:hypothetical protein
LQSLASDPFAFRATSGRPALDWRVVSWRESDHVAIQRAMGNHESAEIRGMINE